MTNIEYGGQGGEHEQFSTKQDKGVRIKIRIRILGEKQKINMKAYEDRDFE